MNSKAKEFTESKSMVIAGVSKNEKKFGNYIFKELSKQGYQLFQLSRTEKELNGAVCYSNLSELRNLTDSIIICTKPDSAAQLIKESAENGFKKIWLQQGAQSPANIQSAKDLGMEVISGRCILMYTEQSGGIHNVHKFFLKLFGKY